jgi:hypothetical protein
MPVWEKAELAGRPLFFGHTAGYHIYCDKYRFERRREAETP